MLIILIFNVFLTISHFQKDPEILRAVFEALVRDTDTTTATERKHDTDTPIVHPTQKLAIVNQMKTKTMWIQMKIITPLKHHLLMR